MKKKRSPTEILESRENKNIEAGLARYPGEEFRDIAHKAYKDSVNFDYTKLQKNKRYVTLHTHPFSHETVSDKFDLEDKNPLNGPNLPSVSDFLQFLKRSNERVMYIAQQDPKTGKVEGYYAIKKTNKTPKIPAEDDIYKPRTDEELRLGGYVSRTYSKIFETNVSAEERGKYINKIYEKYRLKFRAIPAKGFYYEAHVGFKKKRRLEEKLEMAITIFSFIMGLFFLSSNLTGNTIADLSVRETSFIGIGSMIIGLIVGFLWLRNKRS